MGGMLSYLVGIDMGQLFTPDTPLLEIVLRGSVVYLALFFLLRLVLRREAGGFGITDLLVIVLIADAVQNAMAGEYNSITDGLLLGATLIFWSYALDWLAYHWAPFGRFMHPPALRLVKDGQLLRANLRKELLTEDDVMAEIRQQGLEDLAQVKAAFMEFDGRISIIADEEQKTHKPEKRRAA
jgi:uncharacterized membrane protein YcaP (DUF421 family)